MRKVYLSVENVKTDKIKRGFRNWREMARWMKEQIDNGEKKDNLLPICNGCNLTYWPNWCDTTEEFLHFIVDYAIGLQLLG